MKFCCSVLFVCFLGTAFAQEPAVFEEPKNGPKIVFSEERHEFGDITQGDVIEHVFEFTNSGNAPLVLQDVKTTCGCTVPDYPKEPIAAGAESVIKVRFNTKGKSGRNKKPINITANTWPVVSTVHIDGTVQKDESKQAADNKAKNQ